jgi:hypothetical protein
MTEGKLCCFDSVLFLIEHLMDMWKFSLLVLK